MQQALRRGPLPATAESWLHALQLNSKQLPSEEEEEAFLSRRAARAETSQKEAQRCIQTLEGLARRALSSAKGMDLVSQKLHHRLRKWLQGRPEELYAPVPWRSMLEIVVCAIAAHAPASARHCPVPTADLKTLQRGLDDVRGASSYAMPGTPRQSSPPLTVGTTLPHMEESTFYVDGFLLESNEAPLNLQVPATKRSMAAREGVGGDASASAEEPQGKRPALRLAPSNSAAALLDALEYEQQQQRQFEASLGMVAAPDEPGATLLPPRDSGRAQPTQQARHDKEKQGAATGASLDVSGGWRGVQRESRGASLFCLSRSAC